MILMLNNSPDNAQITAQEEEFVILSLDNADVILLGTPP